MLRTLPILVLFTLFTIYASAQKSRDLLYKFPEKNNSNFVDAKTLYDKISSGSYYKVSNKNLSRFAEVTAFEKENLFCSGKVYIGWEKMEQYLNKVLQKILPDSLKNNPDIHVYPARIAELNAFALFDGSLFFNVELFANITNEASVAIILGHELGHYLMKDNLYNFIKINKYKRKVMKSNEHKKTLKFSFEYAKFSRQQEITADSIGFSLAKKSGYNLYYGIDNFRRFQDIETAAELKKAPSRIYKNDSIKGQLSRSEMLKLIELYPENYQRIENLNNFILRDTSGIKKEFLVSESDFKELQELSKYETLNILLKSNRRECVKIALIYYLTEPNNPDYLYYMVESLRQYLSIDPKVKDQTFLTDDFLGKQFKKGEGILHNLSYLLVDSAKMALIQSTELLNKDVIEFETYGQAFDYFSKLAISQNNREALLSLALAEMDTARQNQYLNQYLAFDTSWYKSFATAFKSNTIYSDISNNSNDVILYTRPEYSDFTRFGFNKDYFHEAKLSKKIKAKFSTFERRFPEKKVLITDDFGCVNLNQLINYNNIFKDLQYFRKNDSITKFDVEKKRPYIQIVKGLDAFTINPENWDFVKKNNVRFIRNYFVSGTYDIRAARVACSCFYKIAFPAFIMYYLTNGPFSYYSDYSLGSYNLIKIKIFIRLRPGVEG